MNWSYLSLTGLAVVLTLIGSGPVAAQAPDCTGISDVSDFDGAADSDLDGLLTTVRVASGLLRPVLVTAAPGDTDRLFIVEQNGLIKILTGGAVLSPPFLDVSALTRAPGAGGGNEEGLLGLAFHPDYATNGWFFVYHTNTTGSQNVVARYTRDASDPDLADASSRVVVIAVDHPSNSNHNGGMIAFGPDDGRLYIGSGDGGSSCDPANNGQTLSSNLGKLLRLDVDSLPYGTSGNPYDGPTTGNDEIWSYGLRNPWRFSFDRTTGALYIGDVGQGVWEEVNCEPAGTEGGLNYGWDRYEGLQCPNPSCGSQGGCVIRDNTFPVRVYDHSTSGFSCSVTGGYVYRGCRMGDLHGTYFYADYCSDFIRTFNTDGACNVSAEPDLVRTSDLAPGGGLSITSITSFGEDERGEIYVVDRAGEIFKILPVLSIVEVAGENAAPLLWTPNGWTWEDLATTSSHPITDYKVYRSEVSATGPFVCAHGDPVPAWQGDDPERPDSGAAYYYLVTAINEAGQETRAGNRSDETLRTVDTNSPCPE